MLSSSAVTRACALWENLAGAPVRFSGHILIAVAARSWLCPPGWVGIVVIGDVAIATAPTAEIAQGLERSLSAGSVASFTDPAYFSASLNAQVLGPATLAYLDPVDFRLHRPSLPIGHLNRHDQGVQELLDTVGSEDAVESGFEDITSPTFVLHTDGHVLAAAGYDPWPAGVAHICGLTTP